MIYIRAMEWAGCKSLRCEVFGNGTEIDPAKLLLDPARTCSRIVCQLTPGLYRAQVFLTLHGADAASFFKNARG